MRIASWEVTALPTEPQLILFKILNTKTMFNFLECRQSLQCFTLKKMVESSDMESTLDVVIYMKWTEFEIQTHFGFYTCPTQTNFKWLRLPAKKTVFGRDNTSDGIHHFQNSIWWMDPKLTCRRMQYWDGCLVTAGLSIMENEPLTNFTPVKMLFTDIKYAAEQFVFAHNSSKNEMLQSSIWQSH